MKRKPKKRKNFQLKFNFYYRQR